MWDKKIMLVIAAVIVVFVIIATEQNTPEEQHNNGFDYVTETKINTNPNQPDIANITITIRSSKTGNVLDAKTITVNKSDTKDAEFVLMDGKIRITTTKEQLSTLWGR